MEVNLLILQEAIEKYLDAGGSPYALLIMTSDGEMYIQGIND